MNIDPTLKFSEHYQKASDKGNQNIGMVRRSFDFMDSEILV